MRHSWQSGKLAVVAFTSGFILMAFELIGARLLAPAIGSSTYVWTSVIGVIIAALSTGYFLGGKLADRRNRVIDVAFLCLGISLSIGVMLVTFDPVMESVTSWSDDQRLRGVFASLFLFAPTSLLLGMLSPYLVKLNVTSLSTSGQSVASLSALNSIGGIVGTFITGFIVFSYLGSREALAIITLLALISSWLFIPGQLTRMRVFFSLSALIVIGLPLTRSESVVQIDTPSAHYEVRTAGKVGTDTELRFLATGPGTAQSGFFVQRPNELAFWYTREIARITKEVPAKQSILILGGGAFSLPDYFAKAYPDSQIDVVEFDPHLTAVASRYFNYKAPNNVRVISDDARAYINSAAEQYDVVVVDVYSDTSVPFSLLSQEFGQALGKNISPNGTVIVNAIAGQTGPCAELLRVIDQPYRVVAPHALLSREAAGRDDKRVNLILTYSKTAQSIDGAAVFNATAGRTYTDNFMPAERLQQDCQTFAKE